MTNPLPKELRRDLSLWVRFHAGLGKALWAVLIGVILGLLWARAFGLL